MNSLRVLMVALLASILLFGQETPKPASRILLIEHVTLIDSTGAPPKPDVSVLIDGGKIKTIKQSSRAKSPSGALRIDATGKFLIAGLWDMHVHALSRNEPDRFFPLFIANGVTGIRDMGGDIPLREVARMKADFASGSQLGPELFAAGPILEGEHPFWPFSIAVKGPTDARRAVSQLVEEKADFLKVYNTLSRDSYLAIASLAKENRIPYVGHIPDSVTPAEASDLGQKSIEHLWGIPPYLASDPEQIKKMSAEADSAEDPKVAGNLYYKINQTVLASYDEKKAAALFAIFVHNHTSQTPTLVVLRSYATIHDAAHGKDPRNAYMSDDLRKFWDSMGGAPDPRNDEIQLRLFDHNIEIVKAMHAAGVPLLAGTDTPNPYTYPGFSLPEELQLLVSAGLSPMEALQTATIRAAAFLGVENRLGSVEEGKIANLLLLDANPLDDIQNLKRVHAVILRGNFLDRTKLDQLLAAQKKDPAQSH